MRTTRVPALGRRLGALALAGELLELVQELEARTLGAKLIDLGLVLGRLQRVLVLGLCFGRARDDRIELVLGIARRSRAMPDINARPNANATNVCLRPTRSCLSGHEDHLIGYGGTGIDRRVYPGS
jgi:hypothetical protein